MGIEVVIQDERCDNITGTINDPRGIIARLIPELDDSTFSCLRFIDPYGDAVFNPLQAKVMIDEWDRLRPAFSEQDAEALWADIREMIARCSEEPHTYIKFIGD